MSDEDLSAGARWLNEVSNELSEARMGVICVTSENQFSPWLLFEAGALSKTLDQTHVCPYLLDLTPGQLTGPLSQFQASEATRDGTFRIITTLNRALGADQMSQDEIEETFDVWWPKLSERLEAIPQEEAEAPRRTVDEILEEVVANTREQIRRENLRLEHMQDRDKRVDDLLSNFQFISKFLSQIQALPTMMESLARTPNPSPDDLAKVLRAIPTPDASVIHHMFKDMKDLSEKDRALTQGLLGGPGAESLEDETKG